MVKRFGQVVVGHPKNNYSIFLYLSVSPETLFSRDVLAASANSSLSKSVLTQFFENYDDPNLKLYSNLGES